MKWEICWDKNCGEYGGEPNGNHKHPERSDQTRTSDPNWRGGNPYLAYIKQLYELYSKRNREKGYTGPDTERTLRTPYTKY